jgi:preprotein translocase subunit SecD
MRPLAKVALAAACVFVLTAASVTTARVHLRIYDADGHAKPELTLADIVRSSVRADFDPSSRQAVLFFAFTKPGDRKFHLLTRALARRGARLHRYQHFAFAVNGHVYTRPFIDYKAYPNGFATGSVGVSMSLPSVKVARRLAGLIRSG